MNRLQGRTGRSWSILAAMVNTVAARGKSELTNVKSKVEIKMYFQVVPLAYSLKSILNTFSSKFPFGFQYRSKVNRRRN